MSNKTLFKLLTALGLLVVVLIFLGVNFVPRLSAWSPANNSAVKVTVYAGTEDIERYPSTGAGSVNYAGLDWIERHPSTGAGSVNYAGSDWIKRHISNGAGLVNDTYADRTRLHLPR